MQGARLAGRLQKELKMLQDPPPGICVWPADDHNLSRLEAQIQGPDGTVYAKGIFKLEVEIPDRYPFEPPNVKFITPVYHPNIDSGGRICHDILNMPPKGQWKPSLNIGAVLASIRVLLEEPNHDDGLMSEISAEYKHNRALFDAKARQSTERFATQSSALRDIGSCRENNGTHAATHETSSSKDQKLETHNQDTFVRPIWKEVNRVGASKVTLDELSPSGCSIIPSPIQVKPRQSLASKLSLGKSCSVSIDVITSSHEAVQGLRHRNSLSFNLDKEGPSVSELPSGQSSQGVLQPGENEAHVSCMGKMIVDDTKETISVDSSSREIVNAEMAADTAKSDCYNVDNSKVFQSSMITLQSTQRTSNSGKQSTIAYADAIQNKVTLETPSRKIVDAEATREVTGELLKTDMSSSMAEMDQPQPQMFTSQSSQRTSVTGDRLMLPKSKSLKLSRLLTSATQNVQQRPNAGRLSQESSQKNELQHTAKSNTKSSQQTTHRGRLLQPSQTGEVQNANKGGIIILDSESDEDSPMPSRSEVGLKRKAGYM